MEFTLRLLTAEDAAIYQPVRLAGLRDHPDAFGASYERDVDMPLDEVGRRIARSNVYGAFVGGELVGVTGVVVDDSPKRAHKATIWGVYVRPSARGTGVASALMQAVLDHVAGRVELVQIGVAADNLPARKLYAGFGFEPYGLAAHALKLADGRYVDELLMWKPLD